MYWYLQYVLYEAYTLRLGVYKPAEAKLDTNQFMGITININVKKIKILYPK